MGWSLHHPHGLVYHAPQYCHRGYTLFANLRGFDANLIDMEGRICHRWHWPGGINYANLLPNGNLLFMSLAPDVKKTAVQLSRTLERSSTKLASE